MLKLPLKRAKKIDSKQYPWSSCLPFVENKRAILIHRPRAVSTFHTMKFPHIAVHNWCGNQFTGTDKFTFLEAPAKDGRLLCSRCEVAAVKAGLPSADELAGYHVHLGKLKAIKLCCISVDNSH